MTDRERQVIESYLPHPRDPQLGQDEYYVLDAAGRVQHVRLTDIFPGRPGQETEYGVRRVSDGMRIDPGLGDPFRGFEMFDLYDNRQDCRDRTHGCFSNWEHLRLLQKEEAAE
ncbi:MAG: hypothetical protein MR488_04575 [Lachnospiraceae bacterium]|nr:hypothetical protein [Lachnospiraceae bacterium]